MDIVTNALNKGLSVDVVYLDFEKAFDRVPHKRLLLKLQCIGIHGSLLKWCASFLYHRKQRVVMGDIIGEWKDIISGVPQGSVLGPIFFIIYINNVVSKLVTPCYIFADDTKIPSANTNVNQCHVLQLDLDIIHRWCSEWLLFLNVQKCHVLHFGNKEQLLNKFKYNINGQYLTVEKDLGVFVSSDLNWDKQVSQVCSSANFWFKMISKCFVFKTKDLIRKLYTTLISPYLVVTVTPYGITCILVRTPLISVPTALTHL